LSKEKKVFVIKNVDKPSFAVGLFAGSVLFGFLLVIFVLNNRETVAVDVYTCTYYDNNPSKGAVIGFICSEGNITGDPCPFDDQTEYKGSYLTTKGSINASLEETNRLIHIRSRYGMVNAAMDFLNHTNEVAEKAINPFD